MNRYQINKQMHLANSGYLALLRVSENRTSINYEIIPEIQLQDIRQYRFQNDSEKRLIARSFLYEYLMLKYGMKNFKLGFNEYQKPFLIDNPDIHFSFSYSKDFVLIGISPTTIGIDIEHINEKMEIADIAPTIMHPDEMDHFHSLSVSIQLQRQFFFTLFSSKESIIKAFGTGLYFPVKELNILHNRIFAFQGTSFECKPLEINAAPEYCFAICHPTK